MADEVVGSHLKPEAFYGQNGSDQQSSIHAKSPPIKRSIFAKSVIGDEKTQEALEIVKRDGVQPNAFQTRTIIAAALPTTPGMRSRSGEGGTVPLVTDRSRK